MVISNIHDQVDKDIFGPNYRQQCWTTVVVRYVRSTRRQVGYRTTGWDCDSVRKVIAGQERLRASGTVTGKLVTWLAARGYIDRDSADHATGRAQDASRDLPVADRLGGLLHDVAERAPEIDVDALDDQDWVEDHLAISDVEPGRIGFEGGIGPIAVPRRASDLARPGWSVSVTAARTQDSWHLLEVGFVYPGPAAHPVPTRGRTTLPASPARVAAWVLGNPRCDRHPRTGC